MNDPHDFVCSIIIDGEFSGSSIHGSQLQFRIGIPFHSTGLPIFFVQIAGSVDQPKNGRVAIRTESPHFGSESHDSAHDFSGSGRKSAIFHGTAIADTQIPAHKDQAVGRNRLDLQRICKAAFGPVSDAFSRKDQLVSGTLPALIRQGRHVDGMRGTALFQRNALHFARHSGYELYPQTDKFLFRIFRRAGYACQRCSQQT